MHACTTVPANTIYACAYVLTNTMIYIFFLYEMKMQTSTELLMGLVIYFKSFG